MYYAGQFLVDLSSFFNWFNTLGIASVVLMVFTISKLRTAYLNKLCPSLTDGTLGKGIAIGGVVSIALTLLLTTLALSFFGTVLRVTGVNVNPEAARIAGIDQQSSDRNISALGRPAFGVARAARNPKAMSVVLICVILLVVGAGYAFTALELGLFGHFVAMSLGVGLPEELTKAGAGLFVLYMFFPTMKVSPSEFRRYVLAAFGIAGLGFGAVEALKYFGMYASVDAGIFHYVVRAVWCVTLHGSWSLIVGAALAYTIPQNPQELENQKIKTFLIVLVACLPSALLHGFYNACCFHLGMLMWVTGGLSMILALGAVEGFCDDQSEATQASA